MRAVEDDLAAGGERPNKLLQHERRADIEAGGRFVEDDDRRIVQQRGRDQDLLPHALRIRRQPGVPVVVDVEEAEEPLDLFVEHVGSHLAQPPDERQVLGTGQVGVEVGCFRHVPDPPPVGEELVPDVFAVDADLAVGRLEEPGDDVDRGRLAGSVRAEVAEHLAGPYREADVAHSGQRAVVPGDVHHFEHATISWAAPVDRGPAIRGVARPSDRAAPRAAPAGGTRRPPRPRAAPRPTPV